MGWNPVEWVSLYLRAIFPAPLALIILGVLAALFGLALAFAARAVDAFFTQQRERERTDAEFRKLNAKKHNEHIKLLGSLCNTVGAAVIGAAFILPYIKEHAELAPDTIKWVLVGLAPPFAGQIALRFMRSEG